MAALTQSDEATRLLDLPSEILQMILREAYRGMALDTKYQPSTHKVMPAYPPSILVSKAYTAEAKQAILQEAIFNVRMDSMVSQMIGYEGFYAGFSSDFGLIRHLRIHSAICPGKTKSKLSILVEAAPRLRTLTLIYERPIVLDYADGIKDEGFSGKLTEGTLSGISRELGAWVCSPQKIEINSLTAWGQQWAKREDILEVFMETEVVGRRSLWACSHMKIPSDQHLSVSTYMQILQSSNFTNFVETDSHSQPPHLDVDGCAGPGQPSGGQEHPRVHSVSGPGAYPALDEEHIPQRFSNIFFR
jgi:hypothetical protein